MTAWHLHEVERCEHLSGLLFQSICRRRILIQFNIMIAVTGFDLALLRPVTVTPRRPANTLSALRSMDEPFVRL
jgi:hypothetical protein